MVAILLFTLFTGLLPWVLAQNNSNSDTFTNPVLNEVGADPFVVRHDGYYYLTYTTATNITILRSTSLTDWDNAEAKLAFDPPVRVCRLCMGISLTNDSSVWRAVLHRSLVWFKENLQEGSMATDCTLQGLPSFTRSMINGTSSSLAIPIMVSIHYVRLQY